MEWLPNARVLEARVALPLLSVPVPSVVAPSLKVTVPVGVPPLDMTLAVKVTDTPNVEGSSDEATEVVVDNTGTLRFKKALSIPKSVQVAGQLVRLKTTEVMLAAGVSFKPM